MTETDPTHTEPTDLLTDGEHWSPAESSRGGPGRDPVTQYRYDPITEVLDVTYRDGSTQRFLMVPHFIQRALEAADDLSDFVEQHIANGPFAHARLARE